MAPHVKKALLTAAVAVAGETFDSIPPRVLDSSGRHQRRRNPISVGRVLQADGEPNEKPLRSVRQSMRSVLLAFLLGELEPPPGPLPWGSAMGSCSGGSNNGGSIFGALGAVISVKVCVP